MKPRLEVEDFFVLLSTLLKERRAALRGRGRISFAVTGIGGYLLDLERPEELVRRFDEAADTIVLCNREGLQALAEATLDQAHEPALFLWSGEARLLSLMAQALGKSRSLFATRLAVMNGAL